LGYKESRFSVTFRETARIFSKDAVLIAHEAQYRDWMLAALAGDRDSYRLLLAALTRHLRAYFARRLDSAAAEDAVQETLIALHARRATYDPALPLTAWVHGIARYKLIDEFRRLKRRPTMALDDAADVFAADESEPAAARRDVAKLLARLPADRRKLVEDVKLKGVSIAEAAAATGLSESAVKVQLHRAVKSLGDDLGGGDADR
jgi:RNA polymerase sigma-70 factor (ECF subfamily)